MQIEEIYFLRKIGFKIKDEKEIVTTDRIDKFPNITNYMDEMSRISGQDMTDYIPILKNTVYISCMMYYTTTVFRKGLISKEMFNNVMEKSKSLLKKVKSDTIIGLTVLYEGPHYLYPEVLSIYKESGYTSIVNLYTNLFGSEINDAEKSRNLNILHVDEEKLYLEIYEIFMNESFTDLKKQIGLV